MFFEQPPAIIQPAKDLVLPSRRIIRPGDSEFILPNEAVGAPFVRKKRTSKASSYLYTGTQNSTTSTPSFTGLITSVAYTRHLLIGAAGAGSSAGLISSTSIAGVAGTELFEINNGNTAVSFHIAEIAAGVSGNLALTWSSNKNQHWGHVWEITGLASTTPVDTGSTTADNGNVGLTTVVGGFAFGVAAGGGAVTFSWTNITEDYDAALVSTSSSASHIATTGTALTVASDVSSASSFVVAFIAF